jgi:hypothetical protein
MLKHTHMGIMRFYPIVGGDFCSRIAGVFPEKMQGYSDRELSLREAVPFNIVIVHRIY